MDQILRDWLTRIERKQDEHEKSDKTTFTEIFTRLTGVETKMAKLLVIVGIVNAIAGAGLTVVGLVIAKKFGF